MPKNSAQRGSEHPMSGGSKPPCARAGTIRSVSPGASAGSETSVTASVEDRLAQHGLVVETERGHDRSMRVHRADQAFTLQRHPNGGIAQSAGGAGHNHGVAAMGMIAGRGGGAHGNALFIKSPRIAG